MAGTAKQIHTAGVIGTGAMGRGIAQVLAQAGVAVRLHDTREGAVADAKAFIGTMLDRAVEKGRMASEAAAQAKGRLTPADTLATMAGCDLVIEAVVEDLGVKQTLFCQLEDIVAGDAILATNTSSLSVTAIAAGCRSPERVAGYHYFNPVPLMKLVEVIGGIRTAPWVLDTLEALAHRTGHFPARATDTPGFLVNHAGRGYGTEALKLLGEGVADVFAIDRLMKDAGGFRMGPFELLDLTGLDVSDPVMVSIYRQFYEEPRFRPSPLTLQRRVAGLLGRKTGEGFYRYADGKPQPVPPPEPPSGPDLPIWVSRTRPALADPVIRILEREGALLSQEPSPPANAVLVVTPLGTDASSEAADQGLDATRVVGIDALFGLDSRRTIMTTPITTAEAQDAAMAAFGRDGTPSERVRDSAGLVAQRVIAHIVNVGCEIAQQRIAEPATLDTAVVLGLGYREGPLAMGDRIGAATVLDILRNLHALTGDPRYRPSPWLMRRARLGVPLTTPEP